MRVGWYVLGTDIAAHESCDTSLGTDGGYVVTRAAAVEGGRRGRAASGQRWWKNVHFVGATLVRALYLVGATYTVPVAEERPFAKVAYKALAEPVEQNIERSTNQLEVPAGRPVQIVGESTHTHPEVTESCSEE